MNSVGERKVYRTPLVAATLAWICCAGLFVVGLSMVTIGPGQNGGVGSVVLGGLVLLFALWFGAVLATNRLTATESGLVYWYNLRCRSIGWFEIQAIGVGRSRSVVQWPCPVIQLGNRTVTLTSLASFTARYPARVASELTAMQREFAPGTNAGGEPSGAALS